MAVIYIYVYASKEYFCEDMEFPIRIDVEPAFEVNICLWYLCPEYF